MEYPGGVGSVEIFLSKNFISTSQHLKLKLDSIRIQ